MKIGILGAPGSGKSALAKKLSRAFPGEFTIIDKYVEGLENKTGYYFGTYSATHPQNYQILFHRWTLEQEAENKEKSTISCGTLYESVLYTAIHSLLIEQLEPNNPEESIQIEAAMRGLAMIETLISDYDVLFYLPYDEKMREEKENTFDLVVDQKIPQILEGYYKYSIRLEGTEREKVKNATKYVKQVRAEIKVAEDEQSAVRGSGGSDSEKSEESESVSDLPSDS